jgi:protein SCO1
MSSRSRLVLGVVAAIAAGIGAALALREPPLALRAGTALPEPREIAAFELVDQRGRRFDADSLKGRWSLLFTGFTHCPDICPTTLATMAELEARLGDAAPRLVFVSVDPERDTPDRLAAYLVHFGPDFTGATGTRAQVQAFTRDLGLAQVRNPGTGGEYTVDHSAALVLLDPKARLAGYFQPPHDPEALAADLAALPDAG